MIVGLNPDLNGSFQHKNVAQLNSWLITCLRQTGRFGILIKIVVTALPCKSPYKAGLKNSNQIQ